jgi:hypothetical protein
MGVVKLTQKETMFLLLTTGETLLSHFNKMQPNKALQLTPSRLAPLFTTFFPLPPTFHQLSGFIGVAELGVRSIKWHLSGFPRLFG